MVDDPRALEEGVVGDLFRADDRDAFQDDGLLVEGIELVFLAQVVRNRLDPKDFRSVLLRLGNGSVRWSGGRGAPLRFVLESRERRSGQQPDGDDSTGRGEPREIRHGCSFSLLRARHRSWLQAFTARLFPFCASSRIRFFDAAHEQIGQVARSWRSAGTVLAPEIDDLQVELRPGVLGKDRLQVAFGTLDGRSVRESPSRGEPVDVRVDGKRGSSRTPARRRRSPSCVRLPAAPRAPRATSGTFPPCFSRRISERRWMFFALPGARPHVLIISRICSTDSFTIFLRRRCPAEELRGHQVDALIGRLRREQHGDQKRVRVLVAQGDRGIRIDPIEDLTDAGCFLCALHSLRRSVQVFGTCSAPDSTQTAGPASWIFAPTVVSISGLRTAALPDPRLHRREPRRDRRLYRAADTDSSLGSALSPAWTRMRSFTSSPARLWPR